MNRQRNLLGKLAKRSENERSKPENKVKSIIPQSNLTEIKFRNAVSELKPSFALVWMLAEGVGDPLVVISLTS